MRIGVISDTHGLLRDEAVQYLQTCDVILHAGDVTGEALGDSIRNIKRTYFVRGNCDELWSRPLPRGLIVEEGGFTFAMAHRYQDLPADTKKFDVGIFGHTHVFEKFTETDGTIYLNPGSAGRLRYGATCSMAIMHIDEAAHTLTVERIDLNPWGRG